MLSSRIVAMKLIQAARHFTTTSHDLTNAFCCSDHHTMDERTDGVLNETVAPVIKHRRARMTAKVDAVDGTIDMVATQWGCMGDGNAPEGILGTFHQHMAGWRMGVIRQAGQFYAVNPLDP